VRPVILTSGKETDDRLSNFPRKMLILIRRWRDREDFPVRIDRQKKIEQ